MRLDLDALRRQAESCGGSMTLHQSDVLELLDTIARAALPEVAALLAKLEAAEKQRDALSNAMVAEDKGPLAALAEAIGERERMQWEPSLHREQKRAAEYEAERDTLAAQVAMARWFVEGFRQWWTEVRNRRMDAGPLDFDVEIATDTIERCDLFLADTAQAATEYRERIVLGVVAQTVDTMLAAASEQWDAARSRGVNPVDAFGEVMDRLRADHAGGSR